MILTRSTTLVALLLALVVPPALAELPRAVGRAFLDNGIPLDRVAMVVHQIGRPRPVFVYDADRPMTPASIMKLVTTYAALDVLGRDWRWKTEAYLGGPLAQGTLKGDLILKGYGDPKITVEQWQALMAALRAKGLDTVDGDLALDRSYFALPAHDPSKFDKEPLKPYNVGPDALLVNFKAVKLAFGPDPAGTATQVRTEPALEGIRLGAPPALATAPADCGDWRARLRATFVTLPAKADISFRGSYPTACGERDWWVALLDHPHYVHGMFTLYFREAGGRFSGGLKERLAPTGAAPFVTLESAPLYDIVRDVNKLSNNVMARQIFLTVAAKREGAPATPAKATEAIRRWLAERKLAMPGLVIENGSGLSRAERLTAGGLARLLLSADASPLREEFSSSLAVAATDGTVERRFRDGTVAGQALLKTGSLEGVRSIAGYVIDAEGRRFVVVAIINHPNAARGAPALDHLVQWVYENGATWDPELQR